MSDGMRRELVYLSSHATNRYFIPNWGINAFGHVRFTMYDSKVMPVAGKTIRIAGVEAKSNAQGVVDAIIPIEKQSTVYNLTSSEVSLVDTIKDAKCGDSDAVFTK